MTLGAVRDLHEEEVRLARMAMASRFELVLRGDDRVWLRAIGEEALAEIGRLDRQLSYYDPRSEVSRLNREAATAPVQVTPLLFDLLTRARDLSVQTAGAFDVTMGPLMRCWGMTGAEGKVPADRELDHVLSCTGMHLVELDETRRTVFFRKPGVEIDLGGVGKGFAIDEAVRLLSEVGVTDAFLHGGTSTIMATGTGRDGMPWRVAVGGPVGVADAEGDRSPLAYVTLQDTALSISDIGGKWFEFERETYGHVIDPRSGRPVKSATLAAVCAATATDADALSTALLVLGTAGARKLRTERDDLRMLVAAGHGRDVRIVQSDFDSPDSQRHKPLEPADCQMATSHANS